MRIFYTLLLCLMALALNLTSCVDPKQVYEGHPIIGTWQNITVISSPTNLYTETQTRNITYHPDGHYNAEIITQYGTLSPVRTQVDGKFIIKENLLTMTYHQNGKEITESDYYVINGNVMRVTNSSDTQNSIDFTRVR